MVYTMDQYLGEGVKHDATRDYIHKNTFDFQKKDVAKKVGPEDGDPDEVEGVVPGKQLIEDRDKASRSASQPTKYDLYLEASREAEKEEKRKRRNFDFDHDS